MAGGDSTATNRSYIDQITGCIFPNTEAGTMVGKPLMINDPAATLEEVFRNSRRLTAFFCFLLIKEGLRVINVGCI